MNENLKTQEERSLFFKAIAPTFEKCFPNKIEITAGMSGIYINHPALTMYRLERITAICKMHNLCFVVSNHKGEIQLAITFNALP